MIHLFCDLNILLNITKTEKLSAKDCSLSELDLELALESSLIFNIKQIKKVN